MQGLRGNTDISTTMIYTHMLNKGGRGVLSPLDGLADGLLDALAGGPLDDHSARLLGAVAILQIERPAVWYVVRSDAVLPG